MNNTNKEIVKNRKIKKIKSLVIQSLNLRIFQKFCAHFNYRDIKKTLNNANRAGTALLMTILILNSIVLISLAASKLIVSGVKMSGIQAKSAKAYFAAEAGAEQLLWSYRKSGGPCTVGAENSCHFSKKLPNASLYQVDYINPTVTTFISVGSFSGLKRSVELNFNY